MADTLAQIRVGPKDHGRRMSLAEFQRAVPADGRVFELARGVVEERDIPRPKHGFVLQEIERQLALYQAAHPGPDGPTRPGEREPSWTCPACSRSGIRTASVYLTPPPDDEYPWDQWIPAIVIEVVSPGEEARTRDYVTKREEYLAAGVLEYWIVDPQEAAMLALSRQGDIWRERRLGAADKWRTPLLPEFELELAGVFGAGQR